MKTFKVGDYPVTRIEKMLTPRFAPEFLFPDFAPDILEQHPPLSGPRFRDAASGKVMSSLHL